MRVIGLLVVIVIFLVMMIVGGICYPILPKKMKKKFTAFVDRGLM
jgi:hypothetical protein